MRSPDSNSFSSQALWPAALAIFLTGFVVRLVTLHFAGYSPAHPEPINLAISLVTNGTYANPFGAITGPSAFCMPLHPLLSALLLRIFGTGSAGSQALSYAAIAATALGYALLPQLAVNCGLQLRVGAAAGLFGALTPINFWSQASGVFDAPYAFLVLTALVCITAKHLRAGTFTPAEGAACGLIAAICALTNPSVLPVLGIWFVAAWLYFSDRRPQLLRYMAVVFLIVIVGLMPWALRNKRQLGHLIFTRSAFGLNLHESNNDFATADLEANVRNAKWKPLNPMTSREERQKVRELGEVAYDRAKLGEAIVWIRQHPNRFVRLTIGRIALFWFPRMHRFWQTLVQGAITVLAIAGFIKLWKSRPVVDVFLAIACVGFSLANIVVEVSPRYRFPIEGILLLLGSYFVWETASRRRGAPESSKLKNGVELPVGQKAAY
jgi:4-amino-4-deoxy-L-arabinose transferase-like glycosyltransferase